MQRARAVLSFGREEEAYKETAEALKADSKNIDALLLRARLSMSMMMGDAVSRDLNAGLLVAPDNPYLRASNAEHLLMMGDPRAALRDVSEALEKQPNDVDMLWIRARAYMGLERLSDAKQDLDRALELEPNDRRALIFRAQLHLRRGQFEYAVADADRLLSVAPRDPSIREVRALANTALNRLADAVEDLDNILGKPGEKSSASPVFPRFSQLLVQRAILLMKLDRRDDAILDLDTVVNTGGKRALLRLQLYLKKNGFSELKIDGERSNAFTKAIETCFINQACGRGLLQSL
jgi:tetratricopeptide (TPR) repeat protein